jgi:hypothetical protein
MYNNVLYIQIKQVKSAIIWKLETHTNSAELLSIDSSKVKNK